MSLPHEDAAREHYPNAKSFEAVKGGIPGISRGLIGWTFECKGESGSYRYAWITITHEVTSDPAELRREAVFHLKSYVGNRRRVVLGAKHVAQNTGDATSSGGGVANTGIQFTDSAPAPRTEH